MQMHFGAPYEMISQQYPQLVEVVKHTSLPMHAPMQPQVRVDAKNLKQNKCSRRGDSKQALTSAV